MNEAATSVASVVTAAVMIGTTSGAIAPLSRKSATARQRADPQWQAMMVHRVEFTAIGAVRR